MPKIKLARVLSKTVAIPSILWRCPPVEKNPLRLGILGRRKRLRGSCSVWLWRCWREGDGVQHVES
jgi:hypothetical protein